MASASIAEATTTRSRRGRGVVWDRESIITAIQEWVARYGEPPRAADWNPSSARWSAQDWRVARYRAGREDGSPWPALNSAKRPFDGSLTAAIRAAGFEPAKPGPRRRDDVDLTRTHDADLGADGRAMVDAALADVRQAEARITQLDAQLDRARTRIRQVREERDAARREAARPVVRTKVVRERVVDDAAVTRAVSKAQAAEVKAREAVAESATGVAEARMDAAEARETAQRLAARLERCEATVHRLRAERRMLAAAVRRAEDRTTLTGQPRRLSPTELDGLRAAGPAGPAVLARALEDLANARRSGNPTLLHEALAAVATAAVTWQERL